MFALRQVRNTHYIQVFDALGSLTLQSTLDGYNTCVFVHGAQVYSVILSLLNDVIRMLRLHHLLLSARRPGRRETQKKIITTILELDVRRQWNRMCVYIWDLLYTCVGTRQVSI